MARDGNRSPADTAANAIRKQGVFERFHPACRHIQYRASYRRNCVRPAGLRVVNAISQHTVSHTGHGNCASVLRSTYTHNTAVASFECVQRFQGLVLDTQCGRQLAARPSTYELAEGRVEKLIESNDEQAWKYCFIGPR